MSTAPECNTIPAVVATGYLEKGHWIELGGLKTYITGDTTSPKAIMDIYDVYGPAPQTLQGADLLAAALNAVVIVPDFFKGRYMKSEYMSDTSLEVKELKEAFMKVSHDYATHGEALEAVVKDGDEKWGTKSWAAIGLCWGGKLAVLNSSPGTPFKVTGQVHPGRLASEDVEKAVIPHIVLASKNEDVDIVKAYAEILASPGKTGVVETYADQHHGWMGARANLKNKRNLEEYERGYNQIAQYFSKYL